MTGTKAGAIDFDWLIEHLRVHEIDIEAADADADEVGREKVPTFCLDAKALPAAEQFLLARYTLYEQVYLHKTTRCIERMIGRLLTRLVEVTSNSPTGDAQTGLAEDHPLRRFFAPEGMTVANYLALDDLVVMGAVERMVHAADPLIAELALRLRERRLPKTLDLRSFGHDEGKQRQVARRLDNHFSEQLKSGRVQKDESAEINLYTQIGGDDDKSHKKLHILSGGNPVEIVQVSKMILSLVQKSTVYSLLFR